MARATRGSMTGHVDLLRPGSGPVDGTVGRFLFAHAGSLITALAAVGGHDRCKAVAH